MAVTPDCAPAGTVVWPELFQPQASTLPSLLSAIEWTRPPATEGTGQAPAVAGTAETAGAPGGAAKATRGPEQKVTLITPGARYEASFRPDWIWLPLEAIERMVA